MVSGMKTESTENGYEQSSDAIWSNADTINNPNSAQGTDPSTVHLNFLDLKQYQAPEGGQNNTYIYIYRHIYHLAVIKCIKGCSASVLQYSSVQSSVMLSVSIRCPFELLSS